MKGLSWHGSFASKSLRVYVLAHGTYHTCQCTTKTSNLQMLSYVFMVFLTASLFFQDSAQMALCFSLLPLLGSTTKNMLYYNRVSLFTSQTENKHLESKAIPSLSLHSSFQLSGSLIIFVEWVKNLYGNNIIPLGEITLKNVFINNKYWAFPVR